MQLQVLKPDGTKSSAIRVDNTVFGIEPSATIVHQTVIAELSNRRQGTHSTKSRGMVKGGGKKPWRQKGRGVARAGTIRSPLWVGGGTIFGPQPHKHVKKIPKKMKQLARKSVLSEKAANGQILIVDEFEFDKPKTKEFIKILEALNIQDKKVTVLPAATNENLILSVRNIPNVVVTPAINASTYDLLDCEILLFDKPGLSFLNKQLSVKK